MDQKSKILNCLDTELLNLERLIKKAKNENERLKLEIRKKELLLQQLILKESK